MKFPAYVPAAVREEITALLEGDPASGLDGFEKLLTDTATRLAKTEGDLKEWSRRVASIPEPEVPNAFREKIAELRNDRAFLFEYLEQTRRDVDCLKRLAHDTRMSEAYALLTEEFNDDQQWKNFIHAAWQARIDYSKCRDKLKRAAELKDQIADAAETLASLLNEFSRIYDRGPGEFYSIPELLRQTDNRESLHIWRTMRRHVLGDPPMKHAGKSIDPEEKARNTLRYAWEKAPGLPDLLDTVAWAARRFKPEEEGMIQAAIISRKRNPALEYLRAFGHLLTDAHGFILTVPIMRAMAIVASVVLPGVDATYDDARKALAILGR